MLSLIVTKKREPVFDRRSADDEAPTDSARLDAALDRATAEGDDEPVVALVITGEGAFAVALTAAPKGRERAWRWRRSLGAVLSGGGRPRGPNNGDAVAAQRELLLAQTRLRAGAARSRWPAARRV
jgi:hypothetical protein